MSKIVPLVIAVTGVLSIDTRPLPELPDDFTTTIEANFGGDKQYSIEQTEWYDFTNNRVRYDRLSEDGMRTVTIKDFSSVDSGDVDYGQRNEFTVSYNPDGTVGSCMSWDIMGTDNKNGTCVCSGVTNADGEGGDCNSKSRRYPGVTYCYTEPGACADGKESNSVEGAEYSYQACFYQSGGGRNFELERDTIHVRNTRDMLEHMKDINYTYLGEEYARGILCDVWKGARYMDFSQVGPRPTPSPTTQNTPAPTDRSGLMGGFTYEAVWYFAKSDWDVRGKANQSVPIRLYLNGSELLKDTLEPFYNFEHWYEFVDFVPGIKFLPGGLPDYVFAVRNVYECDVFDPEIEGDCAHATSTPFFNNLECADGSYCDAAKDGWDCCMDKGKRKRCPPNMPNMCANDNDCADDHCCETDCSEKGGNLLCPLVVDPFCVDNDKCLANALGEPSLTCATSKGFCSVEATKDAVIECCPMTCGTCLAPARPAVKTRTIASKMIAPIITFLLGVLVGVALLFFCKKKGKFGKRNSTTMNSETYVAPPDAYADQLGVAED